VVRVDDVVVYVERALDGAEIVAIDVGGLLYC
jgi:hypothetical protein